MNGWTDSSKVLWDIPLKKLRGSVKKRPKRYISLKSRIYFSLLVTDQRMDGKTDRQTNRQSLIYRCDVASKNQ